MTESDFAIIEELLSLTLPTAYRRIMQAYPFRDDRPSDAFIPDHAQYICSLNQQIRDDGVYENIWQPKFFAVGTTWGGDAHVLDTAAIDSPVFRLSQDEQTITAIAGNLDDWVTKLRQWYVEFDAESVAKDYKQIADVVTKAGFFTTSPEPMDGWHRISVFSKSPGRKSFWVASIHNTWFAGVWSGNVYRVTGSIAEFCESWLRIVPDGIRTDFSKEIQTQFQLQSIAVEEFEAFAQSDQ